jgi:dTDP-4-dehydrorhamnose reductase
MKRLKFLITGANGQLAKEFVKELTNRGLEFTALAKEELDISDTNKVFKVIKEVKPDIVINCAAYNLVDKAESSPVEAIAVNTLGVANLAFACADVKATLVHYSTDYVFDGTKVGFYTEEDQPNPLNEYGKSKLFGEFHIQKVLENYDFNLPAKRPNWSVMSNEKISKALGITIRDWKEDLKSFCLFS